MNYMSEVAKMLGVELGEEFSVGTFGVDYVLTNDGLFYTGDNSRCDNILINVLTDRTSINRKPWMPKEYEKFWYVDIDKHIYAEDFCCGHINSVLLYKIGNCYKTREEAEANRNKWIAFYSSDEVVEI